MKRIEIADTAGAASNYELEDGRIFRVHLTLMTPDAALATADYLEVETQGYEILKNGAFVVDDNGLPVHLPAQRARIPLGNVRTGRDHMKGGWVPQTMQTDAEQLEVQLADHKKVKALPKSGTQGDVVRVGDELFAYTDGLYEQVRRGRLANMAQATPAPAPLDAAATAALKP